MSPGLSMDNFDFLNVPRWYRDLPHQREALLWLWGSLPPAVRSEFVRRWRSGPPALVTVEQLRALYPACRVPGRLESVVEPLNQALARYDIVTPLRICHFLAQVGHETGSLNYLEEIWGPTEAQRGYEGRRDLGNTQRGDGYRYRGRGLFQLTGRANYERFAQAVGRLEVVSNPDLVAQPELAVLSAAWFWGEGNRTGRSLNALADADDLVGITRVINGGLNGLTDRLAYLERAKRLWNINSSSSSR